MEMRAAFSHLGQSITDNSDHLQANIQGRSMLLLVTGIGPINAGIALSGLLGEFPKPLGVLNLGVAGSFNLEELPLGQPVLVHEEIWPEYGLVKKNGIDPKGLGLPLGKIHGRPVWDRLPLKPQAHARAMGLVLPDIPQTISLTVAGATGTADRANALRRTYGAAIENMEGFALAWTCARLGIPFLEIRTISNLVGSREQVHWNLQGALRFLGKTIQVLIQPKQKT